jgi:hypothetical protein
MKFNAALLVFLFPTAHAGAVFEEFHTTLGRPAITSTSQYYAQDGMFRSASDGSDSAVIYKNQTVYQLDTVHKTFLVLTKQQHDRKAAELMALIHRDFNDLTPAQRTRVRRELASAVPSQMRTYVRTDRLENVNGYSCRIWEERIRDVKKTEICVVAGGEGVPGGLEMLRCLTELNDFFDTERLGIIFGQESVWTGVDKMGGLPVLVRHFLQGIAVTQSTFRSVRQETFASALFDIPADYALESPGKPSNRRDQ